MARTADDRLSARDRARQAAKNPTDWRHKQITLGYVNEACPECGNFTQVRCQDGLSCDICEGGDEQVTGEQHTTVNRRTENLVEVEFPRFRLTVEGRSQFVPIRQAAIAMNSWFNRVQVGDDVLESDFTVRPITAGEKQEMNYILDEYAASQ